MLTPGNRLRQDDIPLQDGTVDIPRLRALLAAGEHRSFLNGLSLALTRHAATNLDYLRALGGEGLYLALRAEVRDQNALGAYASLLLANKIHATANVVLELHELIPSADLLSVADRMMEDSKNPSADLHMPQENPAEPQPARIQLKRVVQIIDMGFGSFSASDALGIRRSVFRSEQERTFLQALTLRFPALSAFPNYPLDQLADFDKLATLLDAETLRYGRNCRIDAVLVVPGEGDPVAAFELDSAYHDHPQQRKRDRLKNRLFQAIQIPFFRLKATDSISVGVDEWYALLTDEVADKIDCGRRLRIRQAQPTLVPF